MYLIRKFNTYLERLYISGRPKMLHKIVFSNVASKGIIGCGDKLKYLLRLYSRFLDEQWRIIMLAQCG